MNEVPEDPTVTSAEKALARFRRQNEKAWQHILSLSDVLDKEFVELSLAREESGGCDPYDTSTRLRSLGA